MTRVLSNCGVAPVTAYGSPPSTALSTNPSTPAASPPPDGFESPAVSRVPARASIPLESLDLLKPSAALRANRPELGLALSLAQNVYLSQVPPDGTALTARQWESALAYLATWPDPERGLIRGLKPYFRATQPPGPGLDLTRLPSALASDSDVEQLLVGLVQSELLHPVAGSGFIPAAELDAAPVFPATLKLRAYVAFSTASLLEQQTWESWLSIAGPIELSTLEADPRVVAALSKLGLSNTDLERADTDSDGQLRTPDERTALFQALSKTAGANGALSLRRASGSLTALGQLVAALGGDPGPLPKLARPPLRGPLDAANAGDLIVNPFITLRPTDVLAAHHAYLERVAADPGLPARLAAMPFPAKPAAQLDWAFACPFRRTELSDPLWGQSSNDASSELVTYVQGLVEAEATGVSLDSLIPNYAEAQQRFVDLVHQTPGYVDTLPGIPFPTDPIDQMAWALTATAYGWNVETLPQVVADPKARATVHLIESLQTQEFENGPGEPVISPRRVLTVDGQPRVYAVHTPPGTKPANGWPTVVFFHGSYGGNAPEQRHTYQQMNSEADAAGFQVLYPVGAPENRTDGTTGRGMLNWDPVGMGPGGRNDRLVQEMLDAEISAGNIDKSKLFIAGHSQGGFYVSDLMAAYPKEFAGAEIFGAGTGALAGLTDFAAQPRHTPLLMHVGANDPHLPYAQDFQEMLEAAGYGTDSVLESPSGRGHEVIPADYVEMFARFSKLAANPETDAGTLHGTADDAANDARYRTALKESDVTADPEALAALKAVEVDPDLMAGRVPGTVGTLTWRKALADAVSFSPDVRRGLASLAKFYCLTPSPQAPSVDIGSLPEEVLKAPGVVAALNALAKLPSLDLDGWPSLISAAELDLAEGSASVGTDGKAGLETLRSQV